MSATTVTLQLALDAVKNDFLLSTAEAKALVDEIERLGAEIAEYRLMLIDRGWTPPKRDAA